MVSSRLAFPEKGFFKVYPIHTFLSGPAGTDLEEDMNGKIALWRGDDRFCA